MSKLRLNIEDLTVESFAANTTPGLRGTVRGNGYTEWYTCEFNACGGTQPGACDSQMLGCGSGGGTCDQYCTDGDYTCGNYDTCGSPCGISDVTNCHRCTPNQTGYSYCADNESLCIC